MEPIIIVDSRRLTVSNVKTESVQGTRVEAVAPIALLDCGQASKVTKGLPFLLMFEYSTPPFDRALIY